ncbi:hypothetical protein VTL71DRAFT_6501 [Oculimacula yallundae]|uniref:Peptidase A1 domain-containing protein n=1 Tax=Oculimacula yallundae TaxID=86028 RepID=A0ABR4BX54_9HELO
MMFQCPRFLPSVVALIVLNLPLSRTNSLTATVGKPKIIVPTAPLEVTPLASDSATPDGNYGSSLWPISIAPTEEWNGNDGPWNSFALTVGTPPQTQKVMVSTSARNILLVSPEGCPSPIIKDCRVLRGGLFDPTVSKSWKLNFARGVNSTYPISDDPSLGYNGNGTFGYDDVGFEFYAAVLSQAKEQSIGLFAETNSYLGLFGICPRSTYFSSSTDPVEGYLQYMYGIGQIPSMTWAYTAGTRIGKRHASLTLGGYDQAKFNPHNITWQFSSNDLRDLTVQLQAITAYGRNSDKTETSLLSGNIPTFLDSSLPYLWLPMESCLLFEQRFGLFWDSKTELYLVDESLHNSLLAEDPSVVFTLSNGTSGSIVNITLSYALLDLTMSSQIIGAATRYFPLKRATTPSQYILGRTFFQAAYVIANYEQSNFSVHSINTATYEAQELWPILSSSSPNTTLPTSDVEPLFPKSGSNVGPAVGGTLGGVALGGILTLTYFFYVRPRRHKAVDEEKKVETSLPPPSVEIMEDPTFIKPELDNDAVQIHEINADREAVETEVHEQAMYELEHQGEIFESAAQERYVYELPARDAAVPELRTEDNPVVELASPVPRIHNDEGKVTTETKNMNHEVISPDQHIQELDANKDVKYIRLRKTDLSSPSDRSSSKWTWISFRQK